MTAAPRSPRRSSRRRAAEPRDILTTAAPAADQALEPAGFMPLKTERLTLRPFRPEDAAGLHRLINDFDIAKMLELVQFPYQRELADAWIASSARNLAAGTACHLAITGQERDQEVLVGGVGITIDRKSRTGRLGYWVGQK
jgi:8-oxo-dGTP diphosphatase